MNQAAVWRGIGLCSAFTSSTGIPAIGLGSGHGPGLNMVPARDAFQTSDDFHGVMVMTTFMGVAQPAGLAQDCTWDARMRRGLPKAGICPHTPTVGSAENSPIHGDEILDQEILG